MATKVYTKFNEQEYDIKMYLDCGAGESDEKKYPISSSAIVSLDIEETLADWVTKGTLTVYDSFNALENAPLENNEVSRYVFRNDGNDLLYIRIFPILTQLNLEVDRVHWELLYKFSIYDVEDIDLPPGAQNQTATTTKCKKFYFHDSWYQKLITTTLQYSTALSNSINLGSSEPLSDKERSIYTGDAMKEVLDKTIAQNPEIDYPATIAGGSENRWDRGATKIFYTAPATNSAYDTLMDIYSRHVSVDRYSTAPSVSPPRGGAVGTSENDFCILAKERGPNPGDEGYLSLKSVSWYFEKAGKGTPGEFQIEHFYIQDYAPSNQTKAAARRAPVLGQQDLQKDTSLGSYSQITSYRFVDIAPLMNATKFINSPVCSFDFLSRTFNIEFSQNSVQAARNFITKKYISRVTTESTSNEEKLFLITLEKSKENNNTKPVYSLYGGIEENERLSRQADGLLKLLRIGVFQNACINFRCLGSTNREPGRFVAIDKSDGIEDNNFNNKLYGQWFIINVRHVFEGGLYYNDITAVKVYRFKSLDLNLPGTI